MKKLLTIILIVSTLACYAQAEESMDELRTQSGIDPTRVTSRVGYSFMFYDKRGDDAQINNRLAVTLGINRWSFNVKADFVSVNTVPGGGFATGFGDLRFTILNAFYVKGKSAFAGSVEFGLPTASESIGRYAGMGGYFYASPALTYSYTINPGFMMAFQPQYTFALSKNSKYPDLSVLTVRMFVAKFTKSGYFMVFEPRPVYDFQSGKFDFIISPIIGKSLGAGYNLVFLAEIPTSKDSFKYKGAIYQLGVNRSF